MRFSTGRDGYHTSHSIRELDTCTKATHTTCQENFPLQAIRESSESILTLHALNEPPKNFGPQFHNWELHSFTGLQSLPSHGQHCLNIVMVERTNTDTAD